MNNFKENTKLNSYAKKIKWRICLLWVSFVLLLVYMVFIGENGGGDSRIQTSLAETVSRFLFFGGLIYIGYRIRYYKVLLKNDYCMKQELLYEQDERNKFLYDKSGGIVMDILLIVLIFATMTAAMYHMITFYVLLVILVIAIVLKVVTYLLFAKGILK